MQVHTLGTDDQEPEIAVVAGVHGDEVCGVRAIERFRSEDHDLQKPVKLIIANEEALAKGIRYLEADLNRVFPGDPDSDLHEERLAARLAAELAGLTVLDLHSTQSYPRPFAVVSTFTPTTADLVPSTGVDIVADFSALGGDSLADHCDGVVIECGLTGSEEAAENAYHVILNFLAAHGVIDHQYEMTNPDLFRVTGKEPKNTACTLLVENFERVEKGQSYADCEDSTLTADEPFYPVLMSENGYKDILGFRAEKVGTLSEANTS